MESSVAPADVKSFSWKLFGEMIRNGYKTVLVTMGVVLLACWIYITFCTQYYTATMLVSPTALENAPSASSALSSVAGLASMAGISIGSTNSSDFEKYVALLQSRDVADDLAKNQYIMSNAFPKWWDADSKKFVHPWGILGVVDWLYRFALGVPDWHSPTGEDLWLYLQQNLIINANAANTINTIQFKHPNPKFSAAFLQLVHDDANAIMREAARVTSEHRIAYLDKQLLLVTNQADQQALITLLTQEQQKAMLVAADKYYAATMLDPPQSTYWPTWPPGIVLTAAAILIGFLAACTLLATGWDQLIVRAYRWLVQRTRRLTARLSESRAEVH